MRAFTHNQSARDQALQNFSKFQSEIARELDGEEPRLVLAIIWFSEDYEENVRTEAEMWYQRNKDLHKYINIKLEELEFGGTVTVHTSMDQIQSLLRDPSVKQVNISVLLRESLVPREYLYDRFDAKSTAGALVLFTED